jgi:hypothetical protein
MAVTSGIAGQGTLTGAGTQDVLRVATNIAESHAITFTNYSGGDVVLKLFINGVADVNRIGAGIKLETCEVAVLRQKLGGGDDIRAEADTATAIAWTDEMDTLS